MVFVDARQDKGTSRLPRGFRGFIPGFEDSSAALVCY
jgi:hypothetical protein